MANANMFAKVDGVEELLGQVVGAGSMCWEHPELAGVFDSVHASKIITDAMERLSQVIGVTDG